MKRHALVVGIDKYGDATIPDLRYALSDAVHIHSLLEMAGFSYPRLVHDTDRKTVVAELEQCLQGLAEEDLLLIFFSGHGIEHNGKHILLCSDADRHAAESGWLGLPVDLLDEKTREVPGLVRAFILDTCWEAMPGGRGLAGPPMSDMNLRTLVERERRECSRSAGGLTILCACDRGHSAQENKALGHGLFSYAFSACCREHWEKGEDVRLNSDLAEKTSRRMESLADQHGIPLSQRPWYNFCGTIPTLPCGRIAAAPSAPLPDGLLADALRRAGLVSGPAEPPVDFLVLAAGGEAAARHRREYAVAHGGLPLALVNSVGMGFAMIPPPQDGLPFWLSRLPVTQANYLAVCGHEPSRFPGPSHPVESVSWYEAMGFCQRLNEQERARGHLPPGWRYDLPLPELWEHACRAGSRTAFCYGDSLGGDLAHFDGRYPCGEATVGEARAGTAPVGSYPPNAWGLYDMHGNVWEWCAWNPQERSTDESDTRPHCGGGWANTGRRCAAHYHLAEIPTKREECIGFRVALFPPNLPPTGTAE